jgi:O-antigen/teichoic acid export membrane protein
MADELVDAAEQSARGSFFLVSGTAIATLIMGVSSILVARLIGSDLYGQYTLSFVVPQLLFILTDLGINAGIIKFTATLQLRDETGRIMGLIKHGLLLRAFVGFTIFVISYVFAESFASYLLQRPDLTFFVRIASVSVLFQVIFSTVTSAFVGLDKTHYNALATNVQAIAKAVTSLALIFLGLSVVGAIIGQVMGYVVAAVASIAILLIILREKRSFKNDSKIKDDLKILMRYGAFLYVSALLIGSVPLYQNLILAIFTSDSEIGNYKAAVNFISLITVLTVPVSTALLPVFSKLSTERGEKLKTFFKFANKYTTMITIPVAFLIILLANEIVDVVYGSTFQSAALYLTIYSLVYLLVGMGYLTLSSFYNGLGETKNTFKMNLISFIIILVLSPILSPNYGVLGVIISFIAANSLGTFYGAYLATRSFHIEFDRLSISKIYLISTICAISCLPLLYLTLLPKLLNITIVGLLFLFMYLTLMPMTKTVNTYELHAVMSVTQKIRPLALLSKVVLKYEQKLLNIRLRSSTSKTSINHKVPKDQERVT